MNDNNCEHTWIDLEEQTMKVDIGEIIPAGDGFYWRPTGKTREIRYGGRACINCDAREYYTIPGKTPIEITEGHKVR